MTIKSNMLYDYMLNNVNISEIGNMNILASAIQKIQSA